MLVKTKTNAKSTGVKVIEPNNVNKNLTTRLV